MYIFDVLCIFKYFFDILLILDLVNSPHQHIKYEFDISICIWSEYNSLISLEI